METERIAEGIRIFARKLSDGSVTYDVLLEVGASALTLGCLDERHARALAANLAECAWMEER